MWQPALGVLVGLVALEIGYLLCVGPWRSRFTALDGVSRPAPVPLGRRMAFLLGVLALGLALATPLEALAEMLQTAHMIQHLLITLIGPPLLLLGTPGWLLRPLLRWPVVLRSARFVTRARPAFAIGNLTFVLWHFPVLYEAAIRLTPVHIIEHVTFIVAALIMWWPIVGNLPELPRLSSPLQMLYVFLQTLPGALLGIILGMSAVVLYPHYLTVPRLFGLTALGDQQLAGLIMWVGTNIYWLAILTAIFFAWAAREEDDLVSERTRARRLSRIDPTVSEPAKADHAGV